MEEGKRERRIRESVREGREGEREVERGREGKREVERVGEKEGKEVTLKARRLSFLSCGLRSL